jgi:hypothetical protein
MSVFWALHGTGFDEGLVDPSISMNGILSLPRPGHPIVPRSRGPRSESPAFNWETHTADGSIRQVRRAPSGDSGGPHTVRYPSPHMRGEDNGAKHRTTSSCPFRPAGPSRAIRQYAPADSTADHIPGPAMTGGRAGIRCLGKRLIRSRYRGPALWARSRNRWFAWAERWFPRSIRLRNGDIRVCRDCYEVCLTAREQRGRVDQEPEAAPKTWA